MLESFLAPFLFLQKSKNIFWALKFFEEKYFFFENLSRQSLARHPSVQSLLPLGSTWALAISQRAHRGAGWTPGSADPTWQRSTSSFCQRLLAVVPSSSQWCPAILSLNRGRGVGVELSHSTLIHSLPLKLSQTLLSGFHWILAQVWLQEHSHSFLCCEIVHTLGRTTFG